MPTSAESFNLARHCLGRQAAERGAKTALILCDGPDAFRSWTYGELDLKVRKLAGGLIESGLRKGDRVMIRADNDIDFVLAFFATVAIGCVAQPASPLLTAEEALALAEDSGATAIFLGNAGREERERFSHLRVFDSAEARRLAAEGAPADYARDRARRSGLSRLHFGFDRRAEGRAARSSGRHRPPADGTATGSGSPRTTSSSMPAISTGPIRSGSEFSTLSRAARPARSMRARAIRRSGRSSIERIRATIFAAVPASTGRSSNTAICRLSTCPACVMASRQAKRFRPICSPIGVTRPEPGSTKRWA